MSGLEEGMRSRHLVHPSFQALVDSFPRFDLDAEVLAHLRALPSERSAAPTPGVETTEMRVERSGAPALPLLVSTPTSAALGNRAALLWIHGGGYVLGSARDTLAFAERLARDSDCVVVSVDYRLAPETPYPGPLDDCHDALQWTYAHTADLGVDPDRLGVIGESAGGGLAAALSLRARDEGLVPLRFQGLVYPMLDDRTAASTVPPPYAGEFLWTATSNAFAWQCYLGHPVGADEVAPYAAPARATDLTGLPPAFLSVGALDLFADETTAYARALIRAGVPTDLHIHAGAVHGFLQADGIPLSQDVFRQLVAAATDSLAAT